MCECGQKAQRVYNHTTILPKIWDADKEFTNVAPKPMKFPTEQAFRTYLKNHNFSSGMLL